MGIMGKPMSLHLIRGGNELYVIRGTVPAGGGSAGARLATAVWKWPGGRHDHHYGAGHSDVAAVLAERRAARRSQGARRLT